MARAAFTSFRAEVLRIQDLSPTFRRITFGGPGMERFTAPRPWLDLRIKLIIPPAGHASPIFDLAALMRDEGSAWYREWLQVDPALRGSMRTYTVRAWRDDLRELDIDLVLHLDAEGRGGPAAEWAARAELGQTIDLIGQDRTAGEPVRGGIEFDLGDCEQVLLAADETAVPAVASILSSLSPDVRGRALLEVPHPHDVLDLDAPSGVDVSWLPRGSRDHGDLLQPAVRDVVPPDATAAKVDLEEIDIDASSSALWETPRGLDDRPSDHRRTDRDSDTPLFYAWIAGESAMVKELRRYLVRDVGVDRRQVAFMGYWRKGLTESG